MKPLRIRLDPLAALAFALAFFLDGEGLIACTVPAALAHELGHLLALRLCKARVHTLRLGLFGAEMLYSGALGTGAALLCAAAGPAAGLAYALAACALGGPFLLRSGAVSLCLSVWNLLPVLPLDGGRILLALAEERAALRVGEVTATLLCLGGLALLFTGGGPVPLAAGIWLLYRVRARAAAEPEWTPPGPGLASGAQNRRGSPEENW